MPKLKLFMLGPPLVEIDGKRIYFQRRKTLALLVYLVIAGSHQHRNTLATLLWPDLPQRESRANLRRELSLLNNALDYCLECHKEMVSLSPQLEIWLDIDQFLNKLAWVEMSKGYPEIDLLLVIKALEESINLYRSDFLTGFTLNNCLDFDEWQFFQTENLRQSFGNALELLVKLYDRIKNYPSAVHYARRWVSFNTLHEPAHIYLMSLLVKTGQKAAALRQYAICTRILSTELNISPSDEMTALYQGIRTGNVSIEFQPEL